MVRPVGLTNVSEPARRRKIDPEALTFDQLVALAQECSPYSEVVLLLGLGDLRFGEVAGLRVSSVHFETNKIHIRESLLEVSGELYTATLKNHRRRSFIEGSQEPLDELEETLDELVALWSGEVQIDVTLEARAKDALSDSEEVQGIVVEIIREAISNAIRHGDATAIAITISHDDTAQDIVVTVTNDGKPLASSFTPGVGTRFLHDFSHNWSRVNAEGTVILTARVPLNPS